MLLYIVKYFSLQIAITQLLKLFKQHGGYYLIIINLVWFLYSGAFGGGGQVHVLLGRKKTIIPPHVYYLKEIRRLLIVPYRLCSFKWNCFIRHESIGGNINENWLFWHYCFINISALFNLQNKHQSVWEFGVNVKLFINEQRPSFTSLIGIGILRIAKRAGEMWTVTMVISIMVEYAVDPE